MDLMKETDEDVATEDKEDYNPIRLTKFYNNTIVIITYEQDCKTEICRKVLFPSLLTMAMVEIA